jgi:hypothetical protein
VTFKRLVCIVLLTTMIAVLVKPARAEAMDPNLILTLVGVGIAVVAVIAVVIIANMAEGRRRTAAAEALAGGPATVVVYTTVAESP